MFINQEDITKLPGSLVINFNQTSFRIFFTDDRITCFLCKEVGHTSASCKKQISHNSKIATVDDHTTELLEDIQLPELPPIDTTQPQSTMDWNQENNDIISSQPVANTKTSHATMKTPITTQAKRPLSDTNTIKSPTSPTAPGSPMPFIQPEKKKPKPAALDPTLSLPPTTTKSTPRLNLQSPFSATVRIPQSPWTNLNTFWKILETLILIYTHYATKLIPTSRTCLT
ncbi:unnamed protein product [Macrosiphum euphorbiae]|uniref:CCHC-type domain-containing protein n=1 Tax=Macrosiphum euphorbiae TaxID=13131 RepID=A0AAV0VSP3_9HEMI|nr:unnamed protein product [Macrosiphum euphorbiae]